jgi:membrane protease YdiL (CAAX protease family)
MSAQLPGPPAPGATASLGPRLDGRDVLRAVLLGLALFGIGDLILGQVTAGVATAGGRINYLLGYWAVWAFAWLAAIWVVFVRVRGMSFADLGYVVPDRRWAARGVLAGFLIFPAALALALFLRPLLGSESATNIRQYFGGTDFTVFHALTMLLYGGFLVPIAEEMLFRGLLFRWLRQRMDFWGAALISSAIFGVAHLRPDQIVIAALLGLVMAWLYERSRTLVPAILMHQTYNSLGLMMQFAYVWFAPEPTG